jgi:hypothetical protein
LCDRLFYAAPLSGLNVRICMIAHTLQHDAPVPPLDAASARTWTSDPWPQADQSNRRWTKADSPAMPIVSVTLG